MNLNNLSDDALHSGNIRNAKEEREILTRNLHWLRETERRRLFSKYKCKSLFEYAVKFMLYSNDQADRRIKAMRLMRDVPVVEENINSGALNLTNLALAQKLFDLEKKSGNELKIEQKTEVLKRIENKTTREAEKVVFAIRPEMKTRKNELTFNDIDDDGLREKLLQVRGLFAHTHPNISLTELLHKLCDQEIGKKTKVVRASKASKAEIGGAAQASEAEIGRETEASKAEFSRAPKIDSKGESSQASKTNTKAEVTREVWRRDMSQCINCGSTYAVQIEHITPKATGGDWTLENLCLLCRSCNQRSAIEYFGMNKMDKFLNST